MKVSPSAGLSAILDEILLGFSQFLQASAEVDDCFFPFP
jgi:hypothetical protein